jgi:hypothetical protein
VELDWMMEELGMEEQERGEGLILGTSGNMTLDCQVGEKIIDSSGVELCGVDPFSMFIFGEDQIAFDPADVSVFGAFCDMEGA